MEQAFFKNRNYLITLFLITPKDITVYIDK